MVGIFADEEGMPNSSCDEGRRDATPVASPCLKEEERRIRISSAMLAIRKEFDRGRLQRKTIVSGCACLRKYERLSENNYPEFGESGSDKLLLFVTGVRAGCCTTC